MCPQAVPGEPRGACAMGCPAPRRKGRGAIPEVTTMRFLNVMGRDDLELKAVMAVMAAFVMTGAVFLGQML